MPTDCGNNLGDFFSTFGIWIIMLVALVAMFFFTSRSNKKRQKQYQSMLDSIKPGSRVRTIGGIYGTVTSVKEHRIEMTEVTKKEAETPEED